MVQQANRKGLSIAEDRRRRQSLHAAQMRTLEMIINGAQVSDILNQLCAAIDCQVAPSKTVILLIDPDGKKLWPRAGPEISPDWMRAISPLPVAPEIGLCGTAACLKTPVIVEDVATEPHWRYEEDRQMAIRCGIREVWAQPILHNN